MSNTPIMGHPAIGATFTYRPDLPDMTHLPGSEYVARNGDAVEVQSVFHDWNGVEGLTIFYVYVPGTGKFTHFSERELGLEHGDALVALRVAHAGSCAMRCPTRTKGRDHEKHAGCFGCKRGCAPGAGAS